MAKTILVPVDFKVPSLVTLKHALEQNAGGKTAVVLLYAEELSGSITDMLFYGPPKIARSEESAPFREALEMLKNRYTDNITKLSYQFLRFNSLSYLRQLLFADKVTDIYLPRFYNLECKGRAFNPVPLLTRTMLPVHEIAVEVPRQKTEQEHILSLFN